MHNRTEPGWHKSSRSSSGNCVEIKKEDERVLMRNSKDRLGPVLAFPPDAFRAFLADLREDGPAPG